MKFVFVLVCTSSVLCYDFLRCWYFCDFLVLQLQSTLEPALLWPMRNKHNGLGRDFKQRENAEMPYQQSRSFVQSCFLFRGKTRAIARLFHEHILCTSLPRSQSAADLKIQIPKQSISRFHCFSLKEICKPTSRCRSQSSVFVFVVAFLFLFCFIGRDTLQRITY